ATCRIQAFFAVSRWFRLPRAVLLCTTDTGTVGRNHHQQRLVLSNSAHRGTLCANMAHRSPSPGGTCTIRACFPSESDSPDLGEMRRGSSARQFHERVIEFLGRTWFPWTPFQLPS